jgi:hypothetical protein
VRDKSKSKYQESRISFLNVLEDYRKILFPNSQLQDLLPPVNVSLKELEFMKNFNKKPDNETSQLVSAPSNR